MTRNRLVILGCAAVLTIGLSMVSIAGSITDTDGDGVPDSFDNCVNRDNGPLQATFACNAQEDGLIVDGFGRICDTDTNNDGATGLDDVSFTFAAAQVVSTNPTFDYNCDGAAGLDDVARVFADAQAVATPGPSGLACAGVGPYPCVAE
jgi:hypothetical protein